MKSKNTLEREMKSLLDWAKQQGEYPCYAVDYERSFANHFLHYQGVIRYPDMSLYQEILFLTRFCKSKWVVENVKPYYKPLIEPQKCGRHRFWANFTIADFDTGEVDIGTWNRSASKAKQKAAKSNQKERNKVNSKIGLHVWKCMQEKIA